VAVEKIPNWVEARNSQIIGQFIDVNQDGQFWSYRAGEADLPLSGTFTAQQLRDLADMIDANRHFSLAGWAAWGDMAVIRGHPCYGNGWMVRRNDGSWRYIP